MGRYTIQPEQGIIVPHIQASLNPNWVGTDQQRYFQFQNDEQ
ncbi:MAG: lipocalin-like domain-containing protein [Chloroflexi bacterium]|nr:lipocalin-like domain-containing protein [Chloroflexota bacterium]MBP8057174.1 lipocalin-like domain-containing protein [Chloroflexota bacterium]